MRTVLVNGDGSLIPDSVSASYADPRVGVTPYGEILVYARLSGKTGLIAPSLVDCTTIQWKCQTTTMTGSAIKILASSTMARQAILMSPFTNTNQIYFGPDNTCPIALIVGQSFMLPAVTGAAFDLATWYATGTSGNTLIILWTE